MLFFGVFRLRAWFFLLIFFSGFVVGALGWHGNSCRIDTNIPPRPALLHPLPGDPR